MATTTGAPSTDGSARRRGASFGSVLLAFLLGVVLTAAIVVGLLGVGLVGVGDGEELASAPTPTPAPTPTERVAADGPVPQPCLDAAVYNETFTAALDEVAVGVRDQDARRLQEALDAVQDARPGSEQASADCQALAEQEGTAPADDSTSASDAAEPTPTPTP